MLLVLLLCGVLAGMVAAIAGLVAGFPVWAAVGFYVLGGALGICVGGLVLWVQKRHQFAKLPKAGRHAPAEPRGVSPRG